MKALIGYVQVFAVEVAGHVHDLFGLQAFDLTVEPRLIDVKFPGDCRYKLLTLWSERVVKVGTLSTTSYDNDYNVAYNFGIFN